MTVHPKEAEIKGSYSTGESAACAGSQSELMKICSGNDENKIKSDLGGLSPQESAG
jgi:hypothetical protein